MQTSLTHCPCGLKIDYSQCCQPCHTGDAPATTAEALMRSRFSAFYLGCRANSTAEAEHMAQYLIKSAHSTRHEANDLSVLLDNFKHQQWLSLQILNTQTHTVEFAAFFQTAGQTTDYQQLHESSTFIQQDGLWYYDSGKILGDIKIGRNSPCWCGSGKKSKQCQH